MREQKSRMKEEGERADSEFVKMVSAELVATADKELLRVSKRVQDSRRAMIELAKATRDDVIEKEEEEIVTIAEVEKSNEEEEFVTIAEAENSRRATREVIETNDIIEEKEEFATIAKFENGNKIAKHAPKDDVTVAEVENSTRATREVIETNDIIEEKEDDFATIAEFQKTNKVAKHAPKDDDYALDNNHTSPAGVDVVAKQDKKMSSAGKVGEELESIEKKKHELKIFGKKELHEISVSENTMPAGDDDLSSTLEWDTETEEDDVDHDSDECLDPVDSSEKKEQDLERIDDDESPFWAWNKKKAGFALL